MLGDWAELQPDDKCDPPILFHVGQDETVAHRSSHRTAHQSRHFHSTPIHCRICTQLADRFVCPSCINSRPMRTKRGIESFETKKEEFAHIQRKLQQLVESQQSRFALERQQTELVKKAAATRQSCARLQILVDFKRKHIESLRDRLRPLGPERERRAKCLARVEQLIARSLRLESSIDPSRYRREIDQTGRRLSALRQKLLVATYNQVFPLQVSVKMKNPVGNDSLADAIADATCTNYVKDRWIFQDGHLSDIQFRVIQSEVPDNGDYSSFKHARFASPDADTLTAQNFKEYQKVLGIPSGLGFATQLCNAVANILDFPLPFRLGFFNFCGSFPCGNSFDLAVAKLNSNVAILCLSQGFCSSDMIDFGRPLYNLFNLFSNANGVGLRLTAGPFRLPDAMAISFTEATRSLTWEEEITEELNNVDEDAVDDWEAVEVPLDLSPTAHFSPPVKSSGTRQVFNSLFTSATRLLKTATSSNINGLMQ